jgi:hypothetical protein
MIRRSKNIFIKINNKFIDEIKNRIKKYQKIQYYSEED